MRKLILVVDDEFEVLETISAILEDEGYEVLGAADGKEAIDVLSKRKPDLVLSDIMMPHLTGHQLLEEIRKNKLLRSVPVVLMSAGLMKEASLRPDAFMRKPFNLDALLETVKKHVGRN